MVLEAHRLATMIAPNTLARLVRRVSNEQDDIVLGITYLRYVLFHSFLRALLKYENGSLTSGSRVRER